MPTRSKPTMTVYPCRARSQAAGSSEPPSLWVTWEAIEREHFDPHGLLVADFAHPIEVDPAQVRNHRYMPELDGV